MKKLISIQVVVAFVAVLIFQSCSGGDGAPRIKDASEIEVKEATKGIISEIDEVEPGDTYKVLNEEIIDDKMASQAIVHNLDGTTDTLSFAKMKSGEQSTRAGLRPFLMGTMAAAFFSRNLGGANLNPSNYKNTDSFNKSKGIKQNMLSSARTRKMSVPGAGSKGYGKGKSFRSFGG